MNGKKTYIGAIAAMVAAVSGLVCYAVGTPELEQYALAPTAAIPLFIGGWTALGFRSAMSKSW